MYIYFIASKYDNILKQQYRSQGNMVSPFNTCEIFYTRTTWASTYLII